MPYKTSEARRAYDKKRYEENREALNAKSRAYYEANKPKRLEYIREYSKKNLAKLRTIVMEAKSALCADCHGHFHFAAMDFDHRPGELKTATISDLMRNQRVNEKILRAEMAKCDIVCSNCHRVRTYNRGQTNDNMEEIG